MTAEPEKQPTPEELVQEIEARMAQHSWSIPEFFLRVSGLCWILFALILGLFVPLGQLAQASAPRTRVGPRKETITDLNADPAAVFDTTTWVILAGAVLFMLLAGWGMLKASRWGSLPGCAGSLAAIIWLVVEAWGKAGPGTWGLILFVSLLLAVAPVSVWRAWWSLR